MSKLTAKGADWWNHSYFARNLLDKSATLDTYGFWKVTGEDSNPDMGGHHYMPLLGIFEGKLIDVINYATALPEFYTWGAGGHIELYSAEKIKKINADSYLEIAVRKQEKEKIAQQIKDLQKKLNVL